MFFFCHLVFVVKPANISGARDASVASGLNASNIQVGDASLKSLDVCPSKITVPGKRAPLDFTLKTTLQFVSSSSVKWWVWTSLSCISLFYLFYPIRNCICGESHVSITLYCMDLYIYSIGILKIILKWLHANYSLFGWFPVLQNIDCQ